MEKERDRMDNGSYLFRLNQELSGQPHLTPYYAVSNEATGVNEDYDTSQDVELTGAVEEGPVLK